jgi:hypothetical protein
MATQFSNGITEEHAETRTFFRCVSPSTNYSIQLIEGDERVVMDQKGIARSVVLQKPIIAEFQQGGLLDYEIAEALERFNFSGLPDGVNPITRLSVYDPEAEAFAKGWTKEELDAAKARLRHLAEIDPGHFIIVEKPAEAKPWGKYDEMEAEDVIAAVVNLGYDPEAVRKYEHENAGREEVIEAMNAIQEGRSLEGGEIVVEA